MVWNVVVVKISITICLLVPGWIPETCPVSPPEIEVKVGNPTAIPGKFKHSWTTTFGETFLMKLLYSFRSQWWTQVRDRDTNWPRLDDRLSQACFWSFYSRCTSLCRFTHIPHPRKTRCPPPRVLHVDLRLLDNRLHHADPCLGKPRTLASRDSSKPPVQRFPTVAESRWLFHPFLPSVTKELRNGKRHNEKVRRRLRPRNPRELPLLRSHNVR